MEDDTILVEPVANRKNNLRERVSCMLCAGKKARKVNETNQRGARMVGQAGNVNACCEVVKCLASHS